MGFTVDGLGMSVLAIKQLLTSNLKKCDFSGGRDIIWFLNTVVLVLVGGWMILLYWKLSIKHGWSRELLF